MNLMMKLTLKQFRYLVLFLIFFYAGAFAWAGDDILTSEIMTFSDFCERVVSYYPKLKSSAATVELAIARKAQAVAGFLPRAKGFTSMTTSNDQVYVFGTLLRQRAFTQEDFALSRLNNPASRTNYDIGLTAEMPLFDALQTVYKVKHAKYMTESARRNESFVISEAILIAADSYINAIVLDELVKEVNRVCEDSEADIKQADELKDKGLVLGADFYTAKTVFGGLKSLKNNLTSKRDLMYQILNILIGEDPLSPIKLSDDKLEAFVGTVDLNELISDALKSRLDLKAIDEAISAQEAEVARMKSAALPNISAFGDLRENTQNFNTGGGSFAVGLKGSIDIFDPEYFPKVKIAKSELKKMESDRVAAKDSIIRDLSVEVGRFRSVEADLPVLQEMSKDSSQSVALMLPLYREGRKSIADLVQAREAYIRSYAAYYNLIAQTKSSWSRLLFLSGRLDIESSNAIISKD